MIHKTLSKFIVVAVTALYALSINAEDIKYSEAEVKNDVSEFYEKLFNLNSSPTLSDFQFFNGWSNHSEEEIFSEYDYIDSLLGKGNSELADEIIMYRRENPQKVPSLWYRRLRAYLNISNDKINIESISVKPLFNQRPAYIVVASAVSIFGSKRYELTIFHKYEKNRDKEELFVGILKINGKSVFDIQGL